MDLNSDDLLKREQVKLLYEAIPLTVAATIINASVLVVVTRNVIETKLALVWLASILIITFIRLGTYQFYRKAQPEASQTARWKTYFTIGSISAGVLWGSTALFLFPESSIIHQVFVAFIVGGMCAGAVTSLSYLQLPVFSFLFFALNPLIIRFFTVGSEVTNTMGVMLFLFLVMVSISALRTYQNTRQNINLRIHSEQQEKVILESKLEQQVIFDNAPVGIWLVDVDGRYRFVNKTFCDAVGIPESAFLTTNHLSDLLGEKAAANHLKSDRECLEKDEPHLSQETLTFVDGKPHLMEITRVKVKDDSGKVTATVGIAMDITERHLAEDKLRKLSEAIKQAGESVIITDRQGTIEYVNPSFTKITGYSSEEVLGKNPRILKSGNQTEEYYEHLWSTISSGKVWHSTVVDRRKDGSQYPALMTISPILDINGTITHYVGIQQDMTAHEALDEKFRQAQKMEALGTLVGGIAHDFNNMLAGMTGNLYLAKTKVADLPDVMMKLDSVEELSFRAAEMIQQLLTFARQGRIIMKPFGLTSFIKAMSKLSKASIPENISFHSELCHEELVVKGDATQLQQVLMNLLNNARDAVNDVPEPKIVLKIEEFKANKDFTSNHPDVYGTLFAHLIVSDNGSGISDTDKEQIFDPFYTTKEVGLGTGLGLSMTYGAIQSHGGVLEVESTLGEGSSFHIYLPLKEEKEMVDVHANLNEVISGQGELILVVDDNADVRRTCKEVLKDLDYQVLEASDGLEAIEQLTEHKDDIALIIMDVVMPRLGGVKSAERIKKRYPDMKIIFATGYDKDETLKSEMPSDRHLVLSKPYNIVTLSRIIREQLDS